jgi:hypothetical protein
VEKWRHCAGKELPASDLDILSVEGTIASLKTSSVSRKSKISLWHKRRVDKRVRYDAILKGNGIKGNLGPDC